MKKYEMIFKELEQKILDEYYKGGDFLPTEKELTIEYQVSRDTIRKSLSLLSQAGLITKVQGSGSQVTQQEHITFPVSELISYQELVSSLGLSSKTNVLFLEKIRIDQKLHQYTGFPINSIVWKIIRQRLVDGIATVLDIDYLSDRLVPRMSKEIAEKSIYAYLEKELHLEIAFARKDILIDHVHEQDKQYLEIGEDRHVVSIKSQVYLEDQRQFQFTESRHKLDKFHFIDFSRRMKL